MQNLLFLLIAMIFVEQQLYSAQYVQLVGIENKCRLSEKACQLIAAYRVQYIIRASAFNPACFGKKYPEVEGKLGALAKQYRALWTSVIEGISDRANWLKQKDVEALHKAIVSQWEDTEFGDIAIAKLRAWVAALSQDNESRPLYAIFADNIEEEALVNSEKLFCGYRILQTDRNGRCCLCTSHNKCFCCIFWSCFVCIGGFTALCKYVEKQS